MRTTQPTPGNRMATFREADFSRKGADFSTSDLNVLDLLWENAESRTVQIMSGSSARKTSCTLRLVNKQALKHVKGASQKTRQGHISPENRKKLKSNFARILIKCNLSYPFSLKFGN